MADAKLANILMVDDDKDDIYTTMRRISGSSLCSSFLYETDPQKLLEKLEKLEKVDSINNWESGKLNLIILLDINMPRVDGFDILKELKSNEKYKDIPVFMLCTSDDVVDMLDSFELGADGYLVKPIAPNEMLTAINDLGSHKLQLVQ